MILTVKDICAQLLVSERTVLTWIANGELKASNVAPKLSSKKPKWRVSQASLDNFLALRTPTPPLPKVRRRKRPADGVIEFYKVGS